MSDAFGVRAPRRPRAAFGDNFSRRRRGARRGIDFYRLHARIAEQIKLRQRLQIDRIEFVHLLYVTLLCLQRRQPKRMPGLNFEQSIA